MFKPSQYCKASNFFFDIILVEYHIARAIPVPSIHILNLNLEAGDAIMIGLLKLCLVETGPITITSQFSIYIRLIQNIDGNVNVTHYIYG